MVQALDGCGEIPLVLTAPCSLLLVFPAARAVRMLLLGTPYLDMPGSISMGPRKSGIPLDSSRGSVPPAGYCGSLRSVLSTDPALG